jgi:hypothetical protein
MCWRINLTNNPGAEVFNFRLEIHTKECGLKSHHPINQKKMVNAYSMPFIDQNSASNNNNSLKEFQTIIFASKNMA